MTDGSPLPVVQALEPCPFCGGEAHWPEPDVGMNYVGCTVCGACARDECIWNARVAAVLEGLPVRREVAAFALLMERELRANDHKPGWKTDDPNALADRVLDEARELAEATAAHGLSRCYGWNFEGTATEGAYLNRLAEVTVNLGAEAADVANMAMMVADVCGALPATDAAPRPSQAPLLAQLEEMREALEKLVAACDAGRMVPRSGACGMTIDANIRASVYNGVDAWPVEEARDTLAKIGAKS